MTNYNIRLSCRRKRTLKNTLEMNTEGLFLPEAGMAERCTELLQARVGPPSADKQETLSQGAGG